METLGRELFLKGNFKIFEDLKDRGGEIYYIPIFSASTAGIYGAVP